jgi:hypothetical protein
LTLTSFRQAVQDALSDAFPFPFVAGQFEGPSADRDAGCVWARGKREFADNILVEELFLGARVFKQWKQPEGTNDLPNADDLEALLEQVQTTLRPLATTLGPWMFRVTELEILWEQSAVEATLLGMQANLASGGA